MLFDLCKTLDLQLLIAAPEVARAEGNTTYRLVRHVTEDGREEVIVSGRRAAPSAAAVPDEPAPPDEALSGEPAGSEPAPSPSEPAASEPAASEPPPSQEL